MSYILLQGGAEFGGRMAVSDRRALFLAGGMDARISIIPAAAAPDNNHIRAGQNGVRWFQGLGATNVTVLPLIDRKSANDRGVAEAIRHSQLIYLLGGFPGYLGKALIGSNGWQAMLTTHRAGAVIAGSSAGAMVLCQYYYDPDKNSVVKGLGLVPGSCVIPHHDTTGHGWVLRLKQLRPDVVLIGIDEETGMLNDAPQGRWQVYGKGVITLYRTNQTVEYIPGKAFAIES